MPAQKFLTLNSGHQMPLVGLGTWKSLPNEVGSAVEEAIVNAGYRHIDCAKIYLNEAEIGGALTKVFAAGAVKREDLFITSKLWNDAHRPKDVIAACKKTLADLRLDYLDLYLIHWAVAATFNFGKDLKDSAGHLVIDKISIRATWEAMEELVKLGLVRSIGVANFNALLLLDIMSYAKIPPAVNQIEVHPYNVQSRLVEFCQRHEIAVTAYAPLGSPANNNKIANPPVLIKDEKVIAVARSHSKTPAQVLLRWNLQRGVSVIPKSVKPERLKENINVFDFELSSEDMDVFNSLDSQYRFVDPYSWWDVPYFD